MISQRRELKVMTLGDILDYSIEVYKRNFKKLSILALIFYVPFMVVYKIITSYLYMDLQGTFNFARIEEPDKLIYSILAYYLSLIVLGFLNLLYSITIKPVMDVAIINVTYSDVTLRRIAGLKDVIKSSFKKMPSLMGFKILYSLILFGISTAAFFVIYILLFVIILGIFASYGPVSGNENVSVVLIASVVVISLVLFVGVGIGVAYIAVKYMFGIHSLAIEGKSVTGSFSRSSELSSKNFWHIAMSYLLGTVLFLSVPQILSVAVYFLTHINKGLYLVIATIVQFVSSLVYPFIITLTTMLFINLKIKKEGLDLEVKVDMLLEGQRENG